MSRIKRLLKTKVSSFINNLNWKITFCRHLNRAEIERLASKKIYLCPKFVAANRWWKFLEIFWSETTEKAVRRQRRRCSNSAAKRRAKSRSDNFRSRDSSRSELKKKRERTAEIAGHRFPRNRSAGFGSVSRDGARRGGASLGRTFRVERSAEVGRPSDLRKDATASAAKGRNEKRLPRPLRKGLKRMKENVVLLLLHSILVF